MNPKLKQRGPSAIEASASDMETQEKTLASANSVAGLKSAANAKPAVQRKMAEDDETVQRKEKGAGGRDVSAGFESSLSAAKGSGSELDGNTQKSFGAKFGADFGNIKVHNNSRSHELAKEVNAKAFTVGQDIYFNKGQYQPNSRAGKKLLAHELTHTLQQKRNAKNIVQRDLLAYNEESKQKRPRAGRELYVFYDVYSAEAPKLRKVLAGLISSGKIIVSTNKGAQSWFAANHKTCKKAEIELALTKGGYSKASELADKIYGKHTEATYYDQTVKVVKPGFISDTTVSNHTTKDRVVDSTMDRWLTAYEMSEARRVFKSAINLNKVKVSERSIGSAGGYARTIGNFIAFPKGYSSDMELMMHELTHVWQYQKMGASYAPKAIWAQITEGYVYKDKGKTVEQTLIDARLAKKTLYSYNLEQQGDIISDYYRRLVNGGKTAAFLPFINDIK